MTDTTLAHEHVHEEHTTSLAAQIVYFIGGIVMILLALRFLFILIGAGSTGIVNWIYMVTQPLVSPFYGIVGGSALNSVARVEWASLLAMLAVAIITYIIGGLFRILSRTT
ncbi:MAG TPA: hypothetical protein VLE47_02360 [Candidatus Saccharimonadales bacterium]|nr:hypothetical protein [Candidatus Saccharimonadales bacterium]